MTKLIAGNHEKAVQSGSEFKMVGYVDTAFSNAVIWARQLTATDVEAIRKSIDTATNWKLVSLLPTKNAAVR